MLKVLKVLEELKAESAQRAQSTQRAKSAQESSRVLKSARECLKEPLKGFVTDRIRYDPEFVIKPLWGLKIFLQDLVMVAKNTFQLVILICQFVESVQKCERKEIFYLVKCHKSGLIKSFGQLCV